MGAQVLMIPYVIVPPLKLGPFTVQPFGLLVVVGVVVSWMLVVARAKRLGFDGESVHSFLTWMLLGGFFGSHIFDVLFYHPRDVLSNPWLLVDFWQGMSSFGGFFGATLGGFAWKYLELKPLGASGILKRLSRPARRATPMVLLPYSDLMLAAFPVAWIFGRTGCTITHDHPGIAATQDSLFAVAFGPGNLVDYGLFQLRYGTTPRYDLGLIELLLTVPIALGFVLSWKHGGAKGYYVVCLCLLYSPIRFFLDYLRADATSGGDARYFALTPAQWSCVPVFFYGLWLLRRIRSQGSVTASA